MTILRFIAILLFVSIHSTYGQKAQIDNVETVIQREMQERRIPGLQLAVVQHGKVALLKSYGIANLQYSTPVTNQSIFSINSCTKAFTGIAIMQLVEDGKVELAAPVSRYLDALPEAWQPVTIRQLLAHISGLPDVARVIDSDKEGRGATFNEEAIWAKTKAMPMDFPTGEQYSYNQTNYALLGKIIDKFSEKPFAQVFKERQFQVAGMPGTVFGDSRDVIPNKTQSYGFTTKIDGQLLSEPKLTNNYEEFAPFRRTASGLNSTAEDMAHWVMALQQGKLLKTKDALNALWTPATYKNGSPTQWAVGWVTKPRLKHRAVITTGGGRSALFVYPDDDLAIVVLTNLAGSFPEEFIDELAGCYNPDIPAADPVTALHMQLRKRGFENAIDVASELKKKTPDFKPSEDDLNDWAYRLMARRQLNEALGIFKLNVNLYPKSWNVYDSYGEALLKNGQKEDAIAMYKKSIELNPDNQNGKHVLARIAGN
ncbi:serine hydrolase [Spirosoma sp. HMF4905]|uniref:Serine hydrolase n=1 Tax=Spirosoma arboris TaxID=2682092 RepID=A0A7K1SH87_9BACT|nr:serine hydrolase [Spirosoma arboris]MVM33078.1 serine hydrolase [Spirosoma arboris]